MLDAEKSEADEADREREQHQPGDAAEAAGDRRQAAAGKRRGERADNAAGDELPGPPPGEEEGRVALARPGFRSCGVARMQPTRLAMPMTAAASASTGDICQRRRAREERHAHDEQRHDEIELLLDGERPGVQQRLQAGAGVEIAALEQESRHW